jgi:hypothetical protein
MQKKNIITISTLTAITFVAAFVYFKRKKDKVSVFYVDKMIKNYNARTIPPFGIFILKKEKNNINLLNHELTHWNQFKKMGLFKYYFNYFKELNNFGYDKMPMEFEARLNENDYCKNNYTQCVREGISNTVNNKNFRK